MKSFLVLLAGLMLFSTVIFASDFDAAIETVTPVENSPPNVPDSVLINAFPSPDGATRGLAFDGTYLWSADLGDGNSQNGTKIYKLDPNTGAIINSYSSPGTQAFGLAFDGTYLWHTNLNGQTIYQIDPTTMTLVNSFTISCGMLFDLAWDGNYLWAAISGDLILKIDVNTQSVVDTVIANYTTPNVNPMGLTFVPVNNGQIWAGDGNYGSNYINQWDFSSSTWINQWQANPASYPNGLAYDSITYHLWVSCWNTDSIYVYDLNPQSVEEEITENTNYFDLTARYFNGNIELRFSLVQDQVASIKLYNIAGILVESLKDQNYTRGNHDVNLNTGQLSSGLYFITFNGNKHLQTTRVHVVK